MSVASPIFRYETCVEKLQLISSCKPSVDGEAHTRHTEREDFRKEVQQVIQRIEKAKENSCVILHDKRQVYVCNIKGVIFGAIVWDFYTVLHTFVIGLCLPSHIFLNPILILVYVFFCHLFFECHEFSCLVYLSCSLTFKKRLSSLLCVLLFDSVASSVCLRHIIL